MPADERQRIDQVARWFSSFDGFNGRIIDYTARYLVGMCRGRSVLELGCADGSITTFLADRFDRIVAVDGSSELIARAEHVLAAKRNVEFVCSLFEELRLEQRFDTVWMTHVLEHVADPVAVLRAAQRHLAERGVVIAGVPNANSVHRLVGVKMGMLTATTGLSALDEKLGHRRVYTAQLLRQHASAAGLRVVDEGGYFLKPLSSGQMESWPEDLLDAFFEVGRQIPTHAAEIYVVCESA